MNIVLMGPPGAGKGTQAEFIKATYPIPHISTGDIFREAVANGTELGKQAKTYMDSGQLVPDEVTIGIVEERLTREDCQKGFLLDGFPRTTVQAEALDRALNATGKKIEVAMNISAPNNILIERLSGRVSCKDCKKVYNLQYKAPKQEGICDICGGEIIQRDDDKGETVARRLEVYLEQTNPLLDYYREKGLLFELEGNRDSKVVFADIQKILEKF